MRNKILDYFRNAHGEYVSGQQISDDLHVSRTAIWKHIKVLKERGYVFESSTRKGYRLLHAPNLLTELEINSVLSTESFGHNIIYRETAPSTNAIAKEEARRGAPAGTIVVAEEQTSAARLVFPLCEGNLVLADFAAAFFAARSVEMHAAGRRCAGTRVPQSGAHGSGHQMA